MKSAGVLIAVSLAVATACGAAGKAKPAVSPTGTSGAAATTESSPSPSPTASTPSAAPAATASPVPTSAPTPTGFVRDPPQPAITSYVVSPGGVDGVNHLRSGPDGAMWFTTGGMADGVLGRITTMGAVTTWPLPWPNGGIEDFTFGGGFLWSVDYHDTGDLNDTYIGKWNLSGSLLKEYPIPMYDFAITWGPDGALWFSGATAYGMGLSNSFIGRMTVQGDVTTYPMPDGTDIAGSMTTGPDGAIWFSEDPGGSVGRVTTSGAITEYPVPGGGNYGAIAYNQTIVLGPDGALWTIVDEQIARVTTAGVVTVMSALEPSSIGVNPDGDLWFIGEYPGGHDSSVSRMTTGGLTTASYPLDGTPGITDGSPTVITTGPDGMIWFGDGFAIARLDTAIQPTT